MWAVGTHQKFSLDAEPPKSGQAQEQRSARIPEEDVVQMETQFRLVLDEDLARQLAETPTLNGKFLPVEKKPGKLLRLGLAEATAIVTFLAATTGLAKTIAEIAETIMGWMKKQKRPRVKILIEGPRNDAVIEIDEKWDSARLAETIQLTMKED